MKHIPNILTLCRFILIPFIFHEIIHKEFFVAFILLTISGITDIVDGYIARKFNFVTNFGKLVDPLADKFTQISTIVALCTIKIIPEWILIVIFCKEAIMIAGASFLYGKKLIVSSRWYGKLSTVLLYLAIVTTFLINYFGFTYNFDIYFYYVALASTIFSLIMYYIGFYKQGYVNKAELNVNSREVISGKNK